MNPFNNYHFSRNQRGAVAVETVLVLPLVLLLLAGVFETGRLMVLNQKILHATYNAADILTRGDGEITSDDINDAFALVQLSLEPFNSSQTKINMNIVGVTYTAANNVKEIWQDISYAQQEDENLYKKAANTKDEKFGISGEGYLIVKLEYNYEPFLFSGYSPISQLSPFSDFNLTSSYMLKARNTECISYKNNGAEKNDNPTGVSYACP